MKNSLQKISAAVLLTGFLCSVAPAHAGYSSAYRGNNFSSQWTATSILTKTAVLSLIGSFVYTYYKTPQETICEHENPVIDFLDNTWLGNKEVENGTIQEGNRVKPYVIPARGFIGKTMKYFWPISTFCALSGLYLAGEVVADLDLSAAFHPSRR